MTNLLLLKEIAEDISILYVEDELPLQKSVSRYLNNLFSTVDLASNGEEALTLYEKVNMI